MDCKIICVYTSLSGGSDHPKRVESNIVIREVNELLGEQTRPVEGLEYKGVFVTHKPGVDQESLTEISLQFKVGRKEAGREYFFMHRVKAPPRSVLSSVSAMLTS